MTNLLKAEVNRWFSRRLWWAMLLGAVALAALVLVGMAAGYKSADAGPDRAGRT